jgi:ABC-type transport system substrate-binding protein
VRALALSLLLAVGCSQAPPEPGIITVGMYTSVNSLDPRYATDSVSSRAHQLIYNALLDLDQNMRLAPDLAESWDSADYQTYTIKLREGVKFHDGHE